MPSWRGRSLDESAHHTACRLPTNRHRADHRYRASSWSYPPAEDVMLISRIAPIQGVARRIYFKLKDRREAPYDVVVSDPVKAIYFRVPKVANTSIRKALQGNPILQFREARITDGELRSRYRGYFRFGFVRDPRSRIVSAYNNKICFKNPGEVRYLFSQYPSLSHNMPFKAFVEFLLSPAGADRYADRHWLSQEYFFPRDRSGSVQLDWIGKYESLADDWRSVSGRLEIDQSLSHYKRHDLMSGGKYSEFDWNYHEQLYDADLREKVQRRYAGDMAKFGY
jgi:chondroitin 4-sulfotransferase 11